MLERMELSGAVRLEKVLFDSGDATIKPEYYSILDKLVEIVSSIPNPVEVWRDTPTVYPYPQSSFPPTENSSLLERAL